MDSLLRPWLLARWLSAGAAVLLCGYALWVAMRVLRRWRIGSTSEGQLALERQAELVATLVQAALMLSLLGFVLLVLAADRSADSIRGAMCAYGVFDASPVGMAPLAVSALASLGCAGWLALHRLDLALPAPDLTRRKFVALFSLAPLIFLDAAFFGAFAHGLDLDVVASCCSLGLDGGGIGRWGADASGTRGVAFFGLGVGLALAAAIASWVAARRPGRRAAFVGAALSLGAALAMIPAVLYFVAPHAYETPRHLCPFCLLHADVGGVGWPLLGALFLGAASGVAILVVAAQGRAAPEAVREAIRRYGRLGALSWLLCALVASAPVLRYWWVAGGGLFS